MVNEVDMDFRIPGLPHSVVKYAQSTSVRQLIQKIENHPDRHALQQDLRQNQSFNPVNRESKQMIQDVGNIEIYELLEREPKTQCTVSLSYCNIGILCCTCGYFLHKERGANKKVINFSMDVLSIPEYVIKKGRPHGHRCGKKLGDKEYCTANQLKKRCTKKYFQGIHDRFIRDPEFRIRMIENHRDEDHCRRRDALADEDHSHHLTAQEYLHYKSKWWIHSNKVLILCRWGIDLISSKYRPPCNDCKKKQQKNHMFLLTLTNTNNGKHAVHLLHGWIGQFHGGLLISPKVMKEMPQVLSERGDLLLAVFGKLLQKRFSWIQFILLYIDRLQLTAVYCNLPVRGVVQATPQMTRFRDASVQSLVTYKNWRSQNTIWVQVQKWTTKSRKRWTLTCECAVLLFVGQVLVVMIHT